MTEQQAQELAERMEQDQTHEAFRDMARNVAVYYRELVEGGMKSKDALPLTAEMQSVYLCQMMGVELG